MVETVQIDDGHFQEDGDCTLPGLNSAGSPVRMAFSRPAGAMTGKLLPSGNAKDIILVQTTLDSAPVPVEVSLVDAANPFVLVDATTLPSFYDDEGPSSPASLGFIEHLRRQAAVVMGLAPSVEAAALTRGTPKIAVLRQPKDSVSAPDISVLAYSMGKVHGSLQLTGAVCLATAACVPGTVAHEIRGRTRARALKRVYSCLDADFQRVTLRHSGGDMDVDVRLAADGNAEEVTVFRTAR